MMRGLLLWALLAGAAGPALAAEHWTDGRTLAPGAESTARGIGAPTMRGIGAAGERPMRAEGWSGRNQRAGRPERPMAGVDRAERPMRMFGDIRRAERRGDLSGDIAPAPMRSQRPLRTERPLRAERLLRSERAAMARDGAEQSPADQLPAARSRRDGFGLRGLPRFERPDRRPGVNRTAQLDSVADRSAPVARSPGPGIRVWREGDDAGFGSRRSSGIADRLRPESPRLPDSEVRRLSSSRDYHRRDFPRWSSDWRHHHRYDWRSHRRHHGAFYRLGRYHDPFGIGYRRFSVGWSIWPVYYRSSYWLDDPWHYRLPPAYGPYRWIRYHRDALLVNLHTGEVVDVVHDFFW